MDKRKPHYKLAFVKSLIKLGKVRATKVAFQGAVNLDLSLADMKTTILNLTSKDFDKSMTSYADHTQWQDVYKPLTKSGAIYLKFIVIDDVVILSFKENRASG